MDKFLSGEVLIAALLAIVIGAIIGYILRKIIGEKKIKSAEIESSRIIEEAKTKASQEAKEKILSAKEEIHKLRNDLDKEAKEKEIELKKSEKRLINKEENLDKRTQSYEKKEEQLKNKMNSLSKKEEEVEQLIEERRKEVERVSKMTTQEAKDIILDEVKKEMTHECAAYIRQATYDAKEEAQKNAREIIADAIQKNASDYVTEVSVNVVNLPNDEMKGRIIGREGRNIRTLETLTGVDLIIDDTPEAVVLSSFDPIRREICKIALEKLIADGRIHPARIEEMVNKAKVEVETVIKEEGERAVIEAGVRNLHPELVKLLGRLKFRTSYGQNVLEHSIEVAKISATIAEELGADIRLARRGGLLHDIGKSIDQQMEGSHVEIGVNACKRYKENKEVLNIIGSHHGDEEPTTVEAVIVQAADAISAARPGARRETLESYIKRLETLEGIANSFEGIEKSYAIQAGREIRIMVKPEVIDEDKMLLMSRDIAKQIEENLEYPGQIKVTVIRETRSTDYAK
ncbi:ribonuclease Y [Fenollaria massiliensis]|uniref:ribonuclease Y n=1 Tax=Fenollaria massiliensis TaxID=938288 RepID=UPI000367BBA4|nr:ribonuclease Y [Fenollaria massiliensis]OFK79661.1 ribonuclease Y [Anaerosphaera sp. HMSC064C01]